MADGGPTGILTSTGLISQPASGPVRRISEVVESRLNFKN